MGPSGARDCRRLSTENRTERKSFVLFSFYLSSFQHDSVTYSAYLLLGVAQGTESAPLQSHQRMDGVKNECFLSVMALGCCLMAYCGKYLNYFPGFL